MSVFFLFWSNKKGISAASKFPSVVLLLFGFSKGRGVGGESLSGVGVGVFCFPSGVFSWFIYSETQGISTKS
jgi:hypothetical protein